MVVRIALSNEFKKHCKNTYANIIDNINDTIFSEKIILNPNKKCQMNSI